MKKTFRTSLVRAAIGSVALGLTLVVGIGDVAHAEEQPSLAAVTDAGPSTDRGAQPPAPMVIHFPYTPPSMGASSIPRKPVAPPAAPPFPDLPERTMEICPAAAML
jgi:hypothetical protein